jgi:hypothetical protein
MRTPILLAALCAFFLVGCAQFEQQKEKTTTVGQAITIVKNGVEQYLQTPQAKEAHVSLKTADFTFKVTSTVSAGMDATILLFKGGFSGTAQEVHSVTHHYGEDKLFALKALALAPSKSDALVDELQREVARQVPGDVAGKPHSKIIIKKTFGIEKKISVSGQIPVASITLGPNLSLNRNDVQEVELVFSVASTP